MFGQVRATMLHVACCMRTSSIFILQHVETCCNRVAKCVQHVARNNVAICCVKAPAKRSQQANRCHRNMTQHCWAQHAACVWPPCCDMLAVVGSSLKLVKFEPRTPNTSQYVATRWPNASNMLRPTMLRHVALASVGMLRSFGRGLINN